MSLLIVASTLRQPEVDSSTSVPMGRTSGTKPDCPAGGAVDGSG